MSAARGGVSSGRSFTGRAAGRDGSPLMTAIHNKYLTNHRPPASGRPIYTHDGRIGGCLVRIGGVLCLRKTRVRRTEHYCRIHQAFGVDSGVLRQAWDRGARIVRIESDMGVFECELETIFRKGVEDDLGYGRQVFLPLARWRRLDDPQGSLFGGGP